MRDEMNRDRVLSLDLPAQNQRSSSSSQRKLDPEACTASFLVPGNVLLARSIEKDGGKTISPEQLAAVRENPKLDVGNRDVLNGNPLPLLRRQRT